MAELYSVFAQRCDEGERHCSRCSAVHPHWRQRRLSTRPNLLLVVLVRETPKESGGDCSGGRERVMPEDELSLAGVGDFELQGVLYRETARSATPRFSCASRTPSQDFWIFDERGAMPLPLQLSRVKAHSVHALLLGRPGGSVTFAGSGAPPSNSAAAVRGADEDAAKARAELAASAPPRQKSFHGVGSGGGSFGAEGTKARSRASSAPPAAAVVHARAPSDVLNGDLHRCNLGEGVIADIERVFGAGHKAVIDAAWSRDWAGWRELLRFARAQDGQTDDDEAYFQAVFPQVAEVVKRFLLLAVQNSAEVAGTEEERLQALEERGFQRGRGQTFGDNNCCTDSFLQLLMDSGVLRRSITLDERRLACAEFRAFLLSDAEDRLRPRDLRGAVAPERFSDLFPRHRQTHGF